MSHPEPAGDRPTPSEAAIGAARKVLREADTTKPYLEEVLRAAYAVDFPSGESRRPRHPTEPEWNAGTAELYEALGGGYGITRQHAKGLAFRVLEAALRAGDGRPPDEEGANG